jgi:hypothetical protein
VPIDAARIPADALDLPAGERVTATGGSGDTVMLVTEGPDGVERLYLIDGATGRTLRSLTVTRTAR